MRQPDTPPDRPRFEDEDGSVVHPASALHSRLRGDKVPLGSSLTKSQENFFSPTARSQNLSQKRNPLPFWYEQDFISHSIQEALKENNIAVVFR